MHRTLIKEVLNVAEAAKYLRLTTAKVRRWRCEVA